jgi:hypothetical protein
MPDPVHNVLRFFFPGIFKQQQKFVAAESYDKVRLPYRQQHDFRSFFQCLVSYNVALIIIDFFEIVDIGHYDAIRFIFSRFGLPIL